MGIRWCKIGSIPVSWELKGEHVKLRKNSDNSSNWKWVKCLGSSHPWLAAMHLVQQHSCFHFSLGLNHLRFALANGNLFPRNVFDLKYGPKTVTVTR